MRRHVRRTMMRELRRDIRRSVYRRVKDCEKWTRVFVTMETSFGKTRGVPH